VIGALVISKCVKALKGTWPLFANAVEDCGATPNTPLEGIDVLSALDAVEALAKEDEDPACGPNVWVADEPPETRPVAVEEAPRPVRM
jgi:hypothetical protein